ncbi:hypothetical protein CHKEEEPN_4938 [Methylorubrum podarium]|nr:hypothetical protein CHKEEEPN_4938 [Methylorubrum podarium]
MRRSRPRRGHRDDDGDERGRDPPRRRPRDGGAGSREHPAPVSPRRGDARRPRAVELRRTEIRTRLPELRLREPDGAAGRALLDADRPDLRQSGVRHLRHAQPLRLPRQWRGRDQSQLRQPDGSRTRRAGRALRPRRPLGRDQFRRADLPLHAASAGALPRRLDPDSPGRGLLPQYPQGEGPSDDLAGDPGRRRGDGGGQRHSGRPLRRRPQPRPAADRRRAADLLGVLLRGA